MGNLNGHVAGNGGYSQGEPVDVVRPPLLGGIDDWWKQASNDKKLVALATYDHLNDQVARVKGAGNVHCLTGPGEFAAELLFGIDDVPFPMSDLGNYPKQSQLLMDIMNEIGTKLDLPTINVDFIRKFRREYRTDFIRDIAYISKECYQEPEPLIQKRLLSELVEARAQLDRFPVILGQSLYVIQQIMSLCTLGLSKSLLPSLRDFVQTKLPELDPGRKRRWRYALRNKVSRPWEVKKI